MNSNKLTIERINDLIAQYESDGFNDATDSEVISVIAELQEYRKAAEQREPDIYLCKVNRAGETLYSPCGRDYPRGRGYYTKQPAPAVDAVPVVPDEMDLMTCHLDGVTETYAEGWNACRAAMQQPVGHRDELPEETGSLLQLRNLIRQRHAEWSQATFGDVGPVGPLKHLSKEALEAAAEPDDLSEWADMQFLLWDAQRRAGLSDGEITAAMEEKLKVNMARQWPEPKDGEPRQHIKAAPQQEVK